LRADHRGRKREKIAHETRVRNRNTDAPRHPKVQLNLVIRKILARIQAAGVNGFVKGSSRMQYDAEAKPAGLR
jgi:hypothetical protein